MSMLMDIKFSLVRVFGAGLKVECPSVAVLFFPSPRFFPLGFSWEGFLRRQDRLAVYTPMMLLRDDFEALYTLKWFFPIGVIILPQNVLLIVKNTNVIASGMYKPHTKPNQTRTQRLPQDIRKTNKRVSFSTGVIPTTSVNRPQLKSNQLEDRVMSNNSQGKKQEVEDHRRNFKFSNNKMFVTACNDSLNAKTLQVNFVCVTCGKCVLNDNHDLCVLHYINGVNSRTIQPMVVPISTREPKHNVNQSVATSSKKTIATDSTVKKSRHITRKLYEQVSKTCSWWYPKYTPPGYNWKPKSQIGNVNPNISMPLGNASRTANILEHKTPRCSTVSNSLLSSNSFAARRDNL
ncbi:hypothetical protein Tco_1218644 [Tanacetum coccineum]